MTQVPFKIGSKFTSVVLFCRVSAGLSAIGSRTCDYRSGFCLCEAKRETVNRRFPEGRSGIASTGLILTTVSLLTEHFAEFAAGFRLLSFAVNGCVQHDFNIDPLLWSILHEKELSYLLPAIEGVGEVLAVDTGDRLAVLMKSELLPSTFASRTLFSTAFTRLPELQTCHSLQSDIE